MIHGVLNEEASEPVDDVASINTSSTGSEASS
jgi:hypothetical protein